MLSRERNGSNSRPSGTVFRLVVVFGLACIAQAAPAHAADGLARAIEAAVHGRAAVPGLATQPRLHGILRQVYAERDYRPLWIADDELTVQGRAVAYVLENAGNEGLNKADYAPDDIAAARTSAGSEVLARLDLLLSLQLGHFAGDVTGGRISPEIYEGDVVAAVPDVDISAVLNDAAASDDVPAFLHGLAPPHAAYHGLRDGLSALRDIAIEGGWEVQTDGPKLELGSTGTRVSALRRRLAASRDLSPGAVSAGEFDADLGAAVRRFQSRHGLEADGVVGPMTLAALNVSVEARIHQIVVNMERWRWLPHDLGRRYVLVNLAGFELEAVSSGRRVLGMRVVIGRTYRQTPVFSDLIRYLEYNPYWTIPPGILRNDILPKVKADPAYLASQNIRVFDGWTDSARELDPATVPWQSFSRHVPYRLRQDPGPLNALGQFKFMFPNKFNVYLHDSPARELFARARRTFSSGCIRVEDPAELARWLLSTEPGWSIERLEGLVASGRNGAIRLPQPVPVHLTYVTAWPGSGGALHFAEDIYQRDQRLIEALFGTSALNGR